MVTAILGFAILCVMMALPRGRETSRMARCQDNLRVIGVGLSMYHQSRGHYPHVTLPGGDGPLKTMLDAFVIPDFLDLRDPTKPPRPTQAAPRGTRVPGLACPSDLNATATPATPTVSYRACTGDDPGGHGGAFEPGRLMTSAEIGAADGLGFTAAFAERLVGDGRDGRGKSANYVNCPGPVDSAGCPSLSPDRWRGDSGADWAESSWRSTLYSHILTPNAGPSCIAEDRRTALMGASSAHPGRINVLLMDGSLRGVSPTIAPQVWWALGTVGDASKR